ncbi:6122_t:CDS:2 [Funneliformis caledonium]|uniref:6122_t:CDS:1 n=1 Tax=Funneliformis caledonium TaxID=1117310 RepID=A0A9N9AKM8_9GLOM|nr:6122_t:CDS:2 [Funneliformis caledonium]
MHGFAQDEHEGILEIWHFNIPYWLYFYIGAFHNRRKGRQVSWVRIWVVEFVPISDSLVICCDCCNWVVGLLKLGENGSITFSNGVPV